MPTTSPVSRLRWPPYAWKALGASHLACWTMYAGLSVDQHIEVARRFKVAADSVV